MDQREIELGLRLLSRANPPPMLYRYRRPHEWTLAEIRQHQIHLTAPKDLNDPFESSAPVVWHKKSLQRYFEKYALALGMPLREVEKEFNSSFNPQIVDLLQTSLAETRDDSGVISLSAVPDSIRMWSYYAQSHEGVCLGFDTSLHPFFAAMKVKYQNPTDSMDIAATLETDPTLLADHISLRKAAEWEFEQEYRLIIGKIGTRSRLAPFDPSALTEIRLGAQIKSDFKTHLLTVAKQLSFRPKIIQMKCDFDRFILIEEPINF